MKYQYAYDDKNQIIIINNASRYDDYICIECGEKMIPRLGLKNIHHFSHYVDASISNNKPNCSPEHYIHKTAKELFFEAYKADDFFDFHHVVKYICENNDAKVSCYKQKVDSINLVLKYPLIEIEKKDDDFIPDILLSNVSGEKIYIEFAFTHSSSKKKVNSGHKIIEINLTTEEDIKNIINSRLIDVSNNNVNVYGFEDKSFDCNNDCINDNVRTETITKTIKIDKSSYIAEVASESYYRNGSFKFLLKKIRRRPEIPFGLERYRNFIPTLQEIDYEIYLDKELIGSSQSENGIKELANEYVEKHTLPSLF